MQRGGGAALIHRREAARLHSLRGLKLFRNIRAAVAGTGFIGVVHVEALRRLGIEVTGIVGSSYERAGHGQAKNLPDAVRALRGDARRRPVDVVHLATPNHLHDGQVRAVLAAGKHVVCEKPLAMTSAQTGRAAASSPTRAASSTPNFNQRFYPRTPRARRIAAGDLGDVRLVTGGYVQDWLL